MLDLIQIKPVLCPHCGASVQRLKARRGNTLPVWLVPGNYSNVVRLVYCSQCGHIEKKVSDE